MNKIFKCKPSICFSLYEILLDKLIEDGDAEEFQNVTADKTLILKSIYFLLKKCNCFYNNYEFDNIS